MMFLVQLSLAIAAVYSGGTYAVLLSRFVRGQVQPTAELETHSFHLGLCFILATGFLGLMIGG